MSTDRPVPEFSTKRFGGFTYVYIRGEWVNHGFGREGESHAEKFIKLHKLFRKNIENST